MPKPLPPVVRLAGALQDAWMVGRIFVPGSKGHIDWDRFAAELMPTVMEISRRPEVSAEVLRNALADALDNEQTGIADLLLPHITYSLEDHR